jgi:hypothetical protein
VSQVKNRFLAQMANNTVKANISGGTADPSDVSAVSTATASTFMVRDTVANVAINNITQGFTTTATAAGTTTLTVSSTYYQQFTGSTTQTVVLPSATTLVVGQSFMVMNPSTGIVTVNANGGGLIQTMAANSWAIYTVTSTGTSAGTWDSSYCVGSSSPLTTKGDIFTYSTTNARQPVPGDYGALVADSNQSTGWRSAPYTATDGKPGKNYIQYADFENGATTGWTQGTTGTLTNGLPTGTPTFGSGASGTSSISIVSSGQLAGSNSLSYANSAATTAGNMIASSSYAIDAEDQAKVLTIKFYYSVPTGASNCNFSGTSSNSYAWAIYDVTNSSWLTSAGNFNLVQTTGSGYVTGTCQTNATTANIRLVVYSANATSGAATIYLDDFYVGPQTAPSGPAMTDWIAYTPTLTGFGTSTNISFQSRRVGSDLEVKGSFTQGTPTAVQAQISVGYSGANANVTVDTTRVPASGLIGKMALGLDSSTYFTCSVLAPSANQNYVNLGVQTNAATELTAANANNFGVSGTGISVFFTVPIVGWSSNSSMSADTDTRVVAANYTGSTATITSSYSNVTFTTLSIDTHGAYSGATYTIPVTGIYDFGGQVYISGTASLNGTTIVGLSQNGSVTRENDFTYAGAVTGSVGIPFNFGSISCKAGDAIIIQVKSSITLPVITSSATENFLQIARRSGPAVITATESVNARYHGATATITGTDSPVTYTTRDFDSHSAYSGSTYTIPVSGKYQINARISTTNATGTENAAISIYKNGSQVGQQFSGSFSAGNNCDPNISDIIQCNSGDTIVIEILNSGTTPSVTSSNVRNVFSIVRVGN